MRPGWCVEAVYGYASLTVRDCFLEMTADRTTPRTAYSVQSLLPSFLPSFLCPSSFCLLNCSLRLLLRTLLSHLLCPRSTSHLTSVQFTPRSHSAPPQHYSNFGAMTSTASPPPSTRHARPLTDPVLLHSRHSHPTFSYLRREPYRPARRGSRLPPGSIGVSPRPPCTVVQ
jgi:hypothetical protein